MPDQRIEDVVPDDDVSDEDRDRNVLTLIIDSDWPWTIDELARELGTRIGAADSVARLRGTGLVHRLGDLIFPTRAACRADELGLGDA